MYKRQIWDRPNHDNFHVHGYEEKGSTTTPFDMLRLNNMDRWALAADALRMVDAQKLSLIHISFVHIVDSMVNQHCKWLEACVREIPWRAPISGLNILLSSHVWRQDHNEMCIRDRSSPELN